MRKFIEERASKPDGRDALKARRRTSMIPEERIDREVEETLLSFSRDPAPAARPDFDVRLRSRIRGDRSARPQPWVPLFRSEFLVPAVLAVLILLNVVTAVVGHRRASSGTSSRQLAISALAAEISFQEESLSSYWK